MTDLTPSDLSHLSDEEFNALCPQGEHAPGAEPLSPAAQAVLDAATPALNNLDACGFNHQRYDRKALATALRAAADQVVPVTSKPNDKFCCPPIATIVWNRVMEIRKHFLAIATELENYQ